MGAAVSISKRIVKSSAVTLAGVLILSLVLRTANLLSLPIYFDEAGYLRWALDIWDQKTRMALFIPMIEDGKQPLFMWFAGPFAQLTSDPLLGARWVSALAGLASTVGVFLAGYWLSGWSLGLVAALLYAVVPLNLFFDRMALVEALLNAGGIWGFCLSVFVVRRARGRREAAVAGAMVGVALAAALWTKMTAVFVLPMPVLCALLLYQRKQRREIIVGSAVAGLTLGALMLLLSRMPGAENLLDKAGSFAMNPWSLLSFPVDWWVRNVREYWSWIQTYFVAPLWWILLASVIWAFLARRRAALLLLLCWAVAAAPPTLLAIPKLFASRYVANSVFPLYLLAADFMVWCWGALKKRFGEWFNRTSAALAASALMLFVAIGPALAFDYRMLDAPEHAGLPPSDHGLYVTEWEAGFGFSDALQLVRQRAIELTRDGQPIIVLSSDNRGTPYAALKVYMRDIPNVHHYVDSHLARDAEGFMMAWKSHRVPIILVGNQGYDDLESFEREVPQAKRIGFFPKPGGHSSFRVYEVAKEDLEP